MADDRTAQTATAGNPPSNSTPVNSANQITGIGGSNFSYDANGNLLQDDNYQYTYDAENRLMQVQIKNGGAVQTTYAFDGNGTRCVKVVLGGASPNRTFSIYDGGQLLSEFDDASTATYTSGTTPGQAPSDSVSLLLYQHADQLTTRAATDNFGNVAYQRGNFPYGDMWYDTGGASASVKHKFTTYKYEPELSGSLNYALAREHSARLGRFYMADPVQLIRKRNPQLLNRYAYVAGDPINVSDPSGKVPWFFPCLQDYWPGSSPFGGLYWPDIDNPGCVRFLSFVDLYSVDYLSFVSRQDCYTNCLLILTGELAICAVTPPPGDIICAGIALTAYHFCRRQCAELYPAGN